MAIQGMERVTRAAEARYRLPPGLLWAVMQAESGGNPFAVSPVGARGLFQFMPATAQRFGIDPQDPVAAAMGAARYLRENLDRFGGDLNRALAAYNWGEGNVQRKGMARAPAETRRYVQRIGDALIPAAHAAGTPPPPPGFTQPLFPNRDGAPAGEAAAVPAPPPPPPGFTERLDGPPLPGGEPSRGQRRGGGQRWLGQLLSGVNEGLLQTGEALTSVFAPGMGLLLKQLPRTPAQQAQHLGLIGPAPTDTAGRMTRKVGQYVGGSLPFTLAGPLGAAAQPGRLLARDAAAAVASGLGAGIANELAPGSTAAELAGALAPTLVPQGLALGTRTLLRGGARGQQAMQQRLQDFERAGMAPTVGQATGNRLVQGVERGVANLPGGRPLSQRLAQQNDAVATRLQELADSLDPYYQRRGPEIAGRVIQQGLKQFAKRASAQADTLYAAAGQRIPPYTPVNPTRTREVLNAVTAPLPGAESLSAQLINPKLARVAQALRRDANPDLPFEAAAGLRSQLGRELGRPELISELPKAELKQVYGALSDDLARAAADQGPQAAQAWARADRYWRGVMQRQALLKALPRKATPEAVYRAATTPTGPQGATQLRAVMRSLTPEQRRVVTATLVEDLGRVPPHLQDVAGNRASASTFLTHWNQSRLNDRAKAMLFPKGLRESLDSLARVADTIKSEEALMGNPSGTAAAAVKLGAAATGLGSLLVGNPTPLLGLGGAALANNVAARGLANPAIVRWLAQSSAVPAARLPGLAGRAATALTPALGGANTPPLGAYAQALPAALAELGQPGFGDTPRGQALRANVQDPRTALQIGLSLGPGALADRGAFLTEAAKLHYGITRNPVEAGFIAPDGALLRFARARGDAHSNLVDFASLLDGQPQGAAAQQYAFMHQGGMVRVKSGHGIEVVGEPTEAQLRAIAEVATRQRGPLLVDVATPEGRPIDTLTLDNPTPAAVARAIRRALDQHQARQLGR